MKTVFAKVALVALCATALTAVSHSAYAGTVTITGNTLTNGPIPLYGSGIGSNNVVNSPSDTPTGSILYDPTGPNLNLSTTPWIQNGQVSANVGNSIYYVNWFFTGSESGFGIKFSAPNIAGFTEGNQNNNAYAGGPALTNGSYQFLGQSSYAANSALTFDLTWSGNLVDNSHAQDTPGNGHANLIFSYLDPSTLQNTKYADLTKIPGDWFVFALNDNGGGDDNHDDFVGFAQITTTPGETGVTPIPAALPLFGSVLGGGIALGRLRKRRKQKA